MEYNSQYALLAIAIGAVVAYEVLSCRAAPCPERKHRSGDALQLQRNIGYGRVANEFADMITEYPGSQHVRAYWNDEPGNHYNFPQGLLDYLHSL